MDAVENGHPITRQVPTRQTPAFYVTPVRGRARKSPAYRVGAGAAYIFVLATSRKTGGGGFVRSRAIDVTQQVSPDARLLSRQDATLAGNLITDIRGRRCPPSLYLSLLPLSLRLALPLSVPFFFLVVRLPAIKRRNTLDFRPRDIPGPEK